MNPKLKKLWKKIAISPVIGVILIVAITIVIASVAYTWMGGMMGPATEPLVTSIGINGATAGANTIYIAHNGGDAIIDAFKDSLEWSDVYVWNNMIVKKNGNAITRSFNITIIKSGTTVVTDDFNAGDILKITGIDLAINSGDIISVIYTPTNSKLVERLVA